MTAPYLEGLKQLIQQAAGNQPHSVFQYSQPDEFKALWSQLDPSASEQPPLSTVVILWDGTPPSESEKDQRPQDWLTPWDWALVMSLHLHHQSHHIREEGFRCLIFDLLPPLHFASSKAGRQRFKRAHAFVPWVRWYRPLSKPRAAVADYEQFFRDLSNLRESVPVLDPQSAKAQDLEDLRQAWSEMLATPVDRHSIANLVGPLLFLGEAKEDSQLQALQRVIEEVGLISRSDNGILSAESFLKRPWAEEESWRSKIELLRELGCNRLNLVVLDDHVFGHAWGAALCKVLRVPCTEPSRVERRRLLPPVLMGNLYDEHSITLSVYGVASGEAWLESLGLLPSSQDTSEATTTAALSENDRLQKIKASEFRDRRFALCFQCQDQQGKLSSENLDILFLDLRLYAGRPLEDEASFFEKLLPLAEKFKVKRPKSRETASGGPDLPWPGFTNEEISRVHTWITKATKGDPTARREDPEYIEALTFLPRILSLVDLSLPIILFSSTGRRRITEALKPYGNIITDFEKPRFYDAVGSSVAEDTAIGFRNALARALDYTAARQLCARLPKSVAGSVTGGAAVTSTSHRGDEVPWKIELLLDESGEAHRALTLGGLVAVYPPGVRPEDLDAAILAQHPAIKERNGKEYCRTHKHEIARTILDFAHKRGVFVAIVSLTGGHADSVYSTLDSSDELHDERVADNLHRELLRCVAELSIYHLARHVIPQGVKAEFSVRAPTRIEPLYTMDPLKAKALVRALQKYWGIGEEYIGSNASLGRAVKELKRVLWGGNIDGSGSYVDELQVSAKAFLSIFQQAIGSGTVSEPRRAIRYMGFDAARPLVEEIMREYRGSLFSPPADLVRAFALNSHGSPLAAEVTAMHFFADAVVGLDKSDDQGELLILKNYGFEGRYGVQLQTLLETHRLILHSFLAEGIACGGPVAVRMSAASTTAPSGRDVLSQLGQVLQKASSQMTGADFMRLSNLLTKPQLGSEQSESIVGTVYEKGPGHLLIRDARGRVFFAPERDCAVQFNEVQEETKVSFKGYRGLLPQQYRAREVRKAL